MHPCHYNCFQFLIVIVIWQFGNNIPRNSDESSCLTTVAAQVNRAFGIIITSGIGPILAAIGVTYQFAKVAVLLAAIDRQPWQGREVRLYQLHRRPETGISHRHPPTEFVSPGSVLVSLLMGRCYRWVCVTAGSVSPRGQCQCHC